VREEQRRQPGCPARTPLLIQRLLATSVLAERTPSLSVDGKLAFAAVDTLADYWTLPIDANAVLVTDPVRRS